MHRLLAPLPAAISLCLLAPLPSPAQSPIYVRLTPELDFVHVEHAKELSSTSGLSSNSSTSTGIDFVFNLSVGHVSELSGNWLLGGDVQFAWSSRQTVSGSIRATGAGVGAVGTGSWEFSSLVGWGGNLYFGRRSSRDLLSYLMVGVKRWSSEVGSEAVDAVTGPFTDSHVGRRWPWTLGIGFTLPTKRRFDIRLRYFRSGLGWEVERKLQNPNDPIPEDELETVQWDYRFTMSGFGLQIGFGTG